MGAHLEALEQFGQTVGAGVLARDEQFEELHTLAVGGIRSMQAMLDEVRSFAASRPESYRLVPEDLDGIVKFAVEFSRFDPLARERTLTTDLGAGVRVRADALRLYQVLLNLLRNAFQASPRRGRVVVRTGRDGDAAVVDVENEGEPIPPDVRAQIFEPFFTTKGDAGLGLGLSMSRVVVERHGGTITCESAPGRRTTFRVRLPRSA
jgi:signal transduction histidine kinase